MIIQDGVILASHYAPASPYATGFIISLDMGRTWAQYDLKEYGRRSPVRFHKKNSNGWFRVDLRSGWIKRAVSTSLNYWNPLNNWRSSLNPFAQNWCILIKIKGKRIQASWPSCSC